jgi:hypothetical protein
MSASSRPALASSRLWTAFGEFIRALIASIWVLRIATIIGSIAMISKWPGFSAFTLWSLVIWLVPRFYLDRRELLRAQASDQTTNERAKSLEAALVYARQQIAKLEQELRDGQQRQAAGSKGHPVFRRVGLDADCPQWVAEAVRREYRRKLHPDTKPVGQKAEAERRFVETEAVFGEIWRVRGFSRT